MYIYIYKLTTSKEGQELIAEVLYDKYRENYEGRKIIYLNTSNGKSERYLKFAWLKFSLDGQLLRLLVLKPLEFGNDKALFCGFADYTCGEGSYGGGRYLDVTIGKSNKTSLDFNLAYNPYCAYVDKYICPLPPPENILPISIEAGERAYKIEYLTLFNANTLYFCTQLPK